MGLKICGLTKAKVRKIIAITIDHILTFPPFNNGQKDSDDKNKKK